MRPTLGQAGRLEAVDERRHVGGVTAEVLGQVPHGNGLVRRQPEKGLQTARCETRGVAGLVEALLALALEDEAVERLPGFPGGRLTLSPLIGYPVT